jgi:hypothetical protein
MMNRLGVFRLAAFASFGVLVSSVIVMGADEPKQTIDAKGLKFDAPAAWKSSTPTNAMRRAQLKAEPIEGDDYAAELVVFAFDGGAGTVEANLERWQKMFKDEDGNAPKIESKKVKGKNVEVTRAETSGHYYPSQRGGTKEPDRPGARLLGAIVTGDGTSYYIRMIGPDKTMKKLTDDFDAMLKTMDLDGK